ncbi:MAG: UDP-N-acetylmuramoyl-tripeptide--D-alanyl-D-alanine ligase [Anaerolineae bacterium]|nr:UDP-N-acetylmuramoyl-tripeptide--D-alanyl-D-alanine ligase [Anaerolineae bacterium]
MLITIAALVWLAAALYRIVEQARYFQIEEYQNARYLRWLFMQRPRWLPNRPTGVVIVGLALTVLMAEAPGVLLPGMLGILIAVAAGWPARQREVKKPLRLTPRVKRLLSTAFLLAALAAGLAYGVIGAVPDLPPLPFAVAALTGFGLFLLVPLLLVAANIFIQPVEALIRQRFIRQARRVLDEVQPVVIGITGSYGKTSTKTYLAHILNGRFRAYPTPKSYNTVMGICLAINNDLADDHSVEYFIAEMGAYVPGEIQRLCDLTHPRIAIVTEVGPQHLERFGSLENTATAKYEIIKALPPDGVGIFNWDNPHVRAMYQRGYPSSRIAVSREIDPASTLEDGPRFVASAIEESLAGTEFTVTDRQTGQSEAFNSPLLGLHNVTNILLAAAVAIHEGMPPREVAWRVRDLQPAEARLARRTSPEGITIINDAYSANPAGAVQSLRVLGMHTTGKRLLITPGMVELGPLMEPENRKLGEVAAQHATDVILVGRKQTQPIYQGLRAAGFPQDRLHVVDTLSESVAWYQAHLEPGDTVLFLNDLPDTYQA